MHTRRLVTLVAVMVAIVSLLPSAAPAAGNLCLANEWTVGSHCEMPLKWPILVSGSAVAPGGNASVTVVVTLFHRNGTTIDEMPIALCYGQGDLEAACSKSVDRPADCSICDNFTDVACDANGNVRGTFSCL